MSASAPGQDDEDAEWQARKEANRKLRMAYTTDPSSLTEEQQARAMTLLQRDARKLRQQRDKALGGGGSKGPNAFLTRAVLRPVVVGPASGHVLRQQKRGKGQLGGSGSAGANTPNTKGAPATTPPASPVPPASEVPSGLSEEEVAAWKARSEKNRLLRQRYAQDPSSLSEEEQAKALVLLQRDQRKLRQAAKKKKDSKGAAAAAAAAGGVTGQQQQQQAGTAAGGGQAVLPREGSAWQPQADVATVRANMELRERYRSEPTSLSAQELERARVLLRRDEKKRAKKQRLKAGIAKHRERSGQLPLSGGPGGGIKATAEQMALARKWGIAEKLAAAGVGRLKKGLKRGDWECPKVRCQRLWCGAARMRCGPQHQRQSCLPHTHAVLPARTTAPPRWLGGSVARWQLLGAGTCSAQMRWWWWWWCCCCLCVT
jgi:hypothetical protein